MLRTSSDQQNYAANFLIFGVLYMTDSYRLRYLTDIAAHIGKILALGGTVEVVERYLSTTNVTPEEKAELYRQCQVNRFNSAQVYGKPYKSPFQKAADKMAQRTELPISQLQPMPVLPVFRPMPQVVNNITVNVTAIVEPKQQPTELPQRDYPFEMPTPGK